MSGTVIETARLRLRPLYDTDLADFVAMIGDWSVAAWLSRLPYPYSEAHGRDWIATVAADHATGRPRSFAIALRETDRPIGGGGLDGDPGDGTEQAAFGYWLGKDFWGQGYGREAVTAFIDYGFGRLGLEAIRAYTDPTNHASQRVLLACGFKPAGELDLAAPTRHGAARAPLFRIERDDAPSLTLPRFAGEGT